MHDSSVSSRAPRIRHLVAFSALIMLLFCAVVAYQASRAYERALETGRQNASRLSQIVADHVDQTLAGASTLLNRIAEKQHMNALFGNKLDQDLRSHLHTWNRDNRHMTGLLVADRNRKVVALVTKPEYETIFSTSRETNARLFARARGGETDMLLALSPYSSERNAYGMLLAARQIATLDGSFGGMAVGAIDSEYFIRFFRAIVTGQYSALAIQLQDGGTLLFGHPQGTEAMAAVTDGATALLGAQREQTPTVDVRTVDGELKILAHIALARFPVVVTVTLDERDFLRDWRSDRTKDIGFLAIFAVFGSVLSFFALTMAKQIRRVEESEGAAVLASQAKSEFLATMSHELRTPLNAIIGFSEMLDSGYFGPINDKQKERVQDIHLCGNHLLQLINDILEFSKGEAGKLELREEDVSVADIIHECVRLMQERTKAAGIELLSDVPGGLPHLWADKRKIRQILLNLLSNAIKFTPRDGVVKIVAKLDNYENFHIMVSDSGIGIPEEDIPKALSVFGQVHRSKNHEGTGLGLPLCKMFTELHGGKLILKSAVGKGTAVHVIFPQQRILRQGPAV